MSHRRARDLKLTSFVATPVRVSAKPAFATQTPASVKYIVRAGTSKGLLGLGETGHGVTREQLEHHARKLLEIDFDDLAVNRLPIPLDEAYCAFELAIYDILGLELRIPVYQLLGDSCRTHVRCAWPVSDANADTVAAQVKQGLDAGFTTILIAGSDAARLAQTAQAIHEVSGGKARLWLRLTRPIQTRAAAADFRHAIESLPVTAVENLRVLEDSGAASSDASDDRVTLPRCMELYHAPMQGDVYGDPAGKAVLERVMSGQADGYHICHALAPFVRLADVVELAGLSCRHGSSDRCPSDDGDASAWPADLGILEAAHVHAAAASPACVWPSHLYGRTVLTHDLLKRPLSFEHGQIRVPQKPGLGVDLDIKAMERCRAGDDVVVDRR